MDENDIGRICISRAGRDKGRSFAIVADGGDGYAMIADGTMRKLAKPKRKKLKHLHMTGRCLEQIGDKLRAGQKVFDAEIWSALNNAESKGE